MHHFFAGSEQIGENEITITGGDASHIKTVLRLKCGEQISVSDSEGVNYRCEIAETGPDAVKAKILWAQEADTELPCRITLLQALPKSGKMEMIIQKAVELGAFEIVPVASARSVVKLNDQRAEAKIGRWNAVAKSAAEQAKRSIIPEVKPVLSFSDAAAYAAGMDKKLIPYERARDMKRTREVFAGIRPGDSVAVFIGPEGGFTKDEIAIAEEASIEPVTLGKRILRTETAGMTVLSILMYLLEE